MVFGHIFPAKSSDSFQNYVPTTVFEDVHKHAALLL